MYLRCAHFMADAAVIEHSSEISDSRNSIRIRQWCLSVLQRTVYMIRDNSVIAVNLDFIQGKVAQNYTYPPMFKHCGQPQQKWHSLFKRRFEEMILSEVCPLVPGDDLRMVTSIRVSFQNCSRKRLTISCLDRTAFVWHCIHSWAADKMPQHRIEIKRSGEMVCSLWLHSHGSQG